MYRKAEPVYVVYWTAEVETVRMEMIWKEVPGSDQNVYDFCHGHMQSVEKTEALSVVLL